MKLLIPILLCACLCNLSDLMQTDTGGDLASHMFLAAYHGYEVSRDGIVTCDGHKYTIWPIVVQM